MNKSAFIDIDKTATIFLKGVAILFVLLGHMGYIYNGGAWGVSLFLILSGYGVFKSYVENGKNGFFKKKLLKVFLPYFFVTVFMVIYYYIKDKIGLKVILLSLLGIDHGYICDSTMWYISFIFLQYLVFYIGTVLFSRIKNKNTKEIFIIVFCFVMSGIICFIDYKYTLWGKDAGAFLYIFTFSFGLLLSKLSYVKVKDSIKKGVLGTGIFILLVLTTLLYNNATNPIKYFIYANSLPTLLVLLVSLGIIKNYNKKLVYIGEISYDIYLWEGFFLMLRKELFPAMNSTLLIDLFTIVLCICVSQIYKKALINPILDCFSNHKERINSNTC